MKYSRLQKIISYLLLFVFFLNISVNIPSIFSFALAKDTSFYNLVSIIVDEKTYSQIRPELDRYSRDISSNIENTKVIILPVPKDASVFQIASINEALFFDGYKSLEDVDFESKLKTTVFVGDIPIPTVYKGNDFSRTVLPYIDFDDKLYIYNRDTKKYEENRNGKFEIKPEVEFSFISPNTGSFNEDINELKTFFNKNHDYYTGNGIYKQTDFVINGNKDQELNHSAYEPYVFYYDYFREMSSFNPGLYGAYMAGVYAREDLAYNRYSPSHLNKMVEDGTLQSKDELVELAKKVDPNFNESLLGDFGKSSREAFDIQTGVAMNNLKKNFLDSFSKGTTGQLRKDVFNAGRYNFGQNVNVDFPSYVISNMDIITNQVAKDVSDDLEKHIDEFVEDGLSRKIAVPSGYSISEETYGDKEGTGDSTTPPEKELKTSSEKEFGNYLFGRNARTLRSAEDCSIYRGNIEGSGTPVEATRGLNIDLAESDIERLKSMSVGCLSGINENGEGARGLWGKSTPLYIQGKSIKGMEFNLGGGVDYSGAVEPLFDIKGSKFLSGVDFGNPLVYVKKILNPLQCFDNNYILEREVYQDNDDDANNKEYILKRKEWTCRTKSNGSGKTYEYKGNLVERGFRISTDCDVDVFLSGQLVHQLVQPRKRDSDGEEEPVCKEIYRYEAVDSVIKHKEPSTETIKKESEKMATQNLPIDNNRFIDFIRADGIYSKIAYPSMFRIFPKGMTFEDAEKELLFILTKKSDEINEIVALQRQFSVQENSRIYSSFMNSHPYAGKILNIIGKNDKISSILRKGEYPTKKIDLVQFLKSKGSTTTNLFGEEKEISYYDLAVLSVMWANMDSPSERYAFLFEKYLSDENRSSDKYGLPKSRKQYEIAYLGSKGNAQSMMVSLDPEAKKANPYADIIGKNQELYSKLLGYNISNGGNSSGSGSNGGNDNSGESSESKSPFKCAPPDGVPIWEWPKAISCWIKDMLPPKINISEGSCSEYTLGLSFGDNPSFDESNGESDNGGSSNSGTGVNKSGNYPIGLNQSGGNNTCTLDENRNGISDCLEKIDSLKIASDSSTYSYNDYVGLTATFYNGNNKATYLNNTRLNFEIVKVEKAIDNNQDISDNNLEVVYDISNPKLNDQKVIYDLINFSNVNLRSSLGEVKYGFSTKRQEINVYIKAKSLTRGNISSEQKLIESDVIKIEVRSNSLITNAARYNKSSDSFDNSLSSITSSNKGNVYLVDLGNDTFENIKEQISKFSESEQNLIIGISDFTKNRKSSQVKYPLNIKVLKDGKTIQELDIKYKQEYIKFAPISDSGDYTVKITDGNGLSTTRQLYILPSDIKDLDVKLGSNVLLAGGSISTNLLTIYDNYNNPVSGKRYLINLELSGNDFAFLDNSNSEVNTLSLETFEGFKAFRIKTLDKAGQADLKISILDPDSKKLLLSKSQKISSIGDIKLSITGSKNIVVGGGKQKLTINVLDHNGQIISGLNSRLYFSGDSNYFTTTRNYFDIINGKSEVEIITKNLSGLDIPIEVQIEGAGKIFNEKISIKSLEPIKMDIVIGESRLEASRGSFTNVYVELRDRYNNIVTTDSSRKASVSISGNQVLEYNGGDLNFKNGVASFKIYATDTPGIGYFNITANPPLDSNSFTVNSKGGSKVGDITIKGVSQNVGKIETSYFWNKEKIKRQHYNALYTTLLGSNYGDIEQKDYLAGALIFDKNSRALAVTSLLDTGSRKDNIVSINDSGNFKEIFSKSDLSQTLNTNVGIDNGKLYFNIYNKSLNTNIGKVFYNLNDVNLKVCDNDFLSCLDGNKASIGAISRNENYNFYNSGDTLRFVDNFGNIVFTVNNSGDFVKKSDIKFEIDSNNSGDNLLLKLFTKNQYVGDLAINLVDTKVNISRDNDIFRSKKLSSNNSVLVNIESNLYGIYKNGKDNVIFYNDPFASKSSLNTFTNSLLTGYENFPVKRGIGWGDENKTLLSFAAGKSVGEATKDFTSFYLINIGDPFIKLKKQKKTFNGSSGFKKFDSTIGKIISNSDEIKDYKIFDFNNDDKKDIILVRSDNYVEILENKDIDGDFLNHGNLVQIYDLGSFIEAGDFTGDGFGDVFFVSNDGKPYLLNNVGKDFTRIDLTSKLGLTSKVSQASVFDMDNDGKTDIILLDEAGSINIYYGGGYSINPTFTKKTISSGLGLTLGDNKRIEGGVMYFDGLYQPDRDALITSNLPSSPQNIANAPKNIEKGLVDSEIYVNLPYNKTNKNLNLSSATDIPENTEQTYFLKSEYLTSVGVNYEKTFKDRNGRVLASGDTVDVEIKVTNNSGKTISNINLLENFEHFINVDTKTITNSKNIDISSGLGIYNFSIKDFSLSSGESIIIKYSGTSKKIIHLTLRTGLFEKGEPGDDLFGDIIVDDTNLNCGKPLGIYKSIGARTYQKSNSSAQCDSSELPEDIAKLSKDSDKNGVPDYLEDIKSSEEKSKDYAKEKLKELVKDRDRDGVIDDKDFYDGDVMSDGLSNFSQKISDGLDKAEDLLNGLSCGFNNGGCISTPLNWAPLAPGGDPTFMGTPIGDGLRVDEGLPIFSALTWLPTTFSCIPTVYPTSVLGDGCSGLGAGGSLGTTSTSNFFRIFVTPTLTGGVGTAICFGGPASVVGYSSMMPGLAPLFPGGNCIVLAKPIFGCSNDGSDGDPTSLGEPDSIGDYGVINGGSGSGGGKSNTSGRNGKTGQCGANTGGTVINPDYVKDYIKSSGGKTDKSVLGISKYKGAVEDHSTYDGSPIFRVGGGDGEGISVSISSKGGNGDFSDIVQIAEERIKSFPAFLMDWVTRQIDEIVSKLTDFPTIFIVLPDFSGIYDSDLSWQDNWNKYRQRSKNEVSSFNGIDASKLTGALGDSSNKKITQINSGIREAYEFISTLPLINLTQEPVNINVPWISEVEINRAVLSWNSTIDQREAEISKYSDNGEYYDKVGVQINGIIGSIRKNLQIIEEYKKIPEKIKELINKKQDYLEQILCNIESISEIMGGRIGKNGERFKAWVELYILIKAILKSWQALIDIFVNYEEECKECKNERHDLLNWEFQLIDMIIPKIPVIKFPKWPDIVLDFHNIRASLDVSIPEFVVKPKPINLPNLPQLNLPNIPDVNVDLNLPDIPILPELKIPELPDIPSLPKIELPNLPPPLKLPKLFAGFEFIIDIAKLITKAMCILKMSPFHPEWRAGDQIAFLTERNGFLGFDFFNKSLPEFSIPFIDSINVVTYVNLEFETDFLVELAEQLAKPINSFTSDFTNIFKIGLDDLDFTEVVPGSVDIEADVTSYKRNIYAKGLLAHGIVKYISSGIDYAENHKDEKLTNAEFKESIALALSNEKITSNSQFDNLREAWNQVNNYTFAGENELIKNLKEYNFKKYETLKNIIRTEKVKTKNTLRDLESTYNTGKVKVSLKDNESSVDLYNNELSEYNSKTFENIGKVMNYDEKNSPKSEIKELGDKLINRSKQVFGSYVEDYNTGNTSLQNYKNSSRLLAINNPAGTPRSTTSTSNGTCGGGGGGNGDYSYNYSGIYVIEGKRSYRLFDYIDEVRGDEVTEGIDFDGDGDEDLLYFVNNTLYLKENLTNKDNSKTYLSEGPTVLSPSSNKFFNTNFIESVNNAHESDISNGIINLSFDALSDIYNYRLSYYDIVNKYLDINKEEVNIYKNRQIIDGIAGAGEVNKIEDNVLFTKRKDLVYINKIGNFRGLEMSTYKLKAIKEDLLSGNSITISSGTKLYSGINYLDLTFRIDGYEDDLNLKLEPNSNIEAKQDLIIVGISRGNGFVETGEKITYSGDDISKMRGLPIPFDTKITFVGDKGELQNNSYLELYYYDDSELGINFNNTYSWELYDLGQVSSEYLFSISRKNDYYYARINGFKDNILGTSTKQLLLSPQLRADKNTPEIELNSIKIPVYQEQEIDITDKITEDSGVEGISKLFIDFFLEVDTDGDLNTKNDDNSMPNLKIYKKGNRIFVKAGKFTSLMKKKIGINIVDQNGNVGFKAVDFEVYSPTPEIESYDGVTISGRISEELEDEPVNFYRFRGGDLTKLGDEEKGTLTVMTNDKGEFSLKTGLFKGGLTVKDSSLRDIANISERTGKISLDSANKVKYNIFASIDKNTNYPEIFIRDNFGKNIFRQELRVSGNGQVGLVLDFDSLEKNGVYVKTYNQKDFGYYVLPENIKNNPGVLVGYNISDQEKKPIFKVYPDGRLDFPSIYKIEYSSFRNYIILKIKTPSGKDLFDILYKIDADYVIN